MMMSMMCISIQLLMQRFGCAYNWPPSGLVSMLVSSLARLTSVYNKPDRGHNNNIPTHILCIFTRANRCKARKLSVYPERNCGVISIIGSMT